MGECFLCYTLNNLCLLEYQEDSLGPSLLPAYVVLLPLKISLDALNVCSSLECRTAYEFIHIT